MKKAARIFLYSYDETAQFYNYCAALRAAGMEPVVKRDFVQCETCDGLLLPGGGDSDPSLYAQENIACRGINLDRDRKELELIRMFASAGKPILGVCRGHQLLNIAFGGTLIQDIEASDAHMQKDGVDQLHETVIASDSTLAKFYGTEATVNSSHHQAVDCLGEGFTAVQWSKDGVVEAMEHQTLPIISVQWHPERQSYEKKRDGAVDGARIFERLKELCEEPVGR